MPLFGQVWIWSLAGFLVGALLCWLLIANPARRRVTELERYVDAERAKARRAAESAPAEVEPPSLSSFDPIPDEREPHHVPPPPAPLPSTVDESEDRSLSDREIVDRLIADAAETRFIPSARRPDQEVPGDWFAKDADDPREDRHHGERDGDDGRLREDHLVDDEPAEDEPTGTIFTQHTTPIPHELIRELDDREPNRDALVDDLGEDEPAEPDRTRFTPPVQETRFDAFTAPEPDEDHPATDVFHGPAADRLVAADDEPAQAFTPPRPDHEPVEQRDEQPATTVFEPEDFAAFTPAEPGERHPDPATSGDHEAATPARYADQPAHTDVFGPPVTDGPAPVDSPSSGDLAPTAFHSPAAGTLDVSELQADARPEPIEPVRDAEPAPLPVRVPRSTRSGSAVSFSPPPERSGDMLPKRIPSKPQSRFPFGVETSAPSAQPAPASSSVATDMERERSLFEPVMAVDAAEQTQSRPLAPPNAARRQRSATTPPPSGTDPFVAPGPFGAGSAMPLPGGASPSYEYTVKASVTALKYCPPESPKFDRTVAEVWFRSVEDAERVGFRPLS